MRKIKRWRFLLLFPFSFTYVLFALAIWQAEVYNEGILWGALIFNLLVALPALNDWIFPRIRQ